MRDFHTHSNYSDGTFLSRMVRAAEEVGLDGIGVTDHCTVSSREYTKDVRAARGFNLDVTYERRRRAIESLREDADVEIYDAVEMDYDPRDEAEIRDFFERADFDYTIGSVHDIAEMNVQVPSNFENMSDDELDGIVDRYFETLSALVESELFDIAAHPDLIERTPGLRGRATDDHYRRLARTFASSRTVPEINAGRALTDAGIVHPAERFFTILREYDVPFTVGSDSHSPEQLRHRRDFFDDHLETLDIEPIAPPGFHD
ncbi:PHP domain-containing protein [Haladaptatus sp. T7]|uniref:PHP domain-containing protein n=1 Tax=Haladaptatus sp. T7 TaxID=2029368 RepID=UPI0021A250F9|nr:PHP domain-containing protein [Haladaptatus sp. T7]GKZ15762.1 histidinol-phosphatase [Haladaptatus sp. T7]